MDINAKRKLRNQLLKYFAQMGSTLADGEAARKKFDEACRKHKMTWNDGMELVLDNSISPDPTPDDQPPPTAPAGSDVNVLECIHHLLPQYARLTEHERVAISLWILHCFVYDRFKISPRLALTSPVFSCGKTTVLEFIEHLVPRPSRTDNISPAALYREIETPGVVLLLDEGDNFNWFSGVLKAVLNSGHRKGGNIKRVISGVIRKYSTFTPTAIAIIGALPGPMMSRSIIINMQRSASPPERRFEEGSDISDLEVTYQLAWQWMTNVKLDTNPEIPAELRGRHVDNWRPLLSIADSFGPHWGKIARDAAVALSRGRGGEDVKIALLADIRIIFDARRVDRMTSAEIVAALNDLEDAPWSEWRGVQGDRPPRRLSQAELAHLLAPFSIRPRSIRLHHERTRKGYFRHQFEEAWAAYCREDGTPAQPSNIRQLRRHGSGTA